MMASQDVVILLIGLHGIGKSTFTAAATGTHVEVGDGVDPCKSDEITGLTTYPLIKPGRHEQM
jgi:ABC-type branched-subunit amino acid transport system ATPase component